MATWQLVIGTVGFGACLVALCAWAMLAAARVLEDDDEPTATTSLRLARPASVDARHGDAGRGDREGVAVLTMQQDLAKRLADRKREAAEAKVYRIARTAQVVKFQR